MGSRGSVSKKNTAKASNRQVSLSGGVAWGEDAKVGDKVAVYDVRSDQEGYRNSWAEQMLENKIAQYNREIDLDQNGTYKVIDAREKALKIAVETHKMDYRGDWYDEKTFEVWMPRSAFYTRQNVKLADKINTARDAKRASYDSLISAAKNAGIKGIRSKIRVATIVSAAKKQGKFDSISNLVKETGDSNHPWVLK